MTEQVSPESKRLIQALQSSARDGNGVKQVELLETHISWILLTGAHAYKIKKPVDLGFVDFSTLARRKFFCEEELRLNRRLASRLYLAVVPITGTFDDPRIGGDGEAIEYAVQMRQFPQEALLNHAIERGTLGPGHIDQLAETIADFHGRIPTAKPEGDTARFGTVESILAAALDNFRAIVDQDLDDDGNPKGQSDLPGEFRKSQAAVQQLLAWTRTKATQLARRFEDRRNAGAIRECHGDMHLGNMLLYEGKVVIFDGIEFNADLRWIDVLSEVAFCLMDLTGRNRPEYAHRLLNLYLEHTGDYRGLDVLPFYLTYRALVRAKVAHLSWQQQAESESQTRNDLARQRQEYLELALRYATPQKPRLLITHGLSGSGKSFGTQGLIENLGAVRVRSDVERKRLAGWKQRQGDLYSAASTSATYQHLANSAEHILAAGYSAILDATYLKFEQRSTARQLADRLNVPFLILDFQAREGQLRERITKRLEQATDPSEADLDVLDTQMQIREPLSEEEQAFVIPVNTEMLGFAEELPHAIRHHQ